MYQISINSNIQQSARSRKRRSGSTQAAQKDCTAKPVRNGFLNQSFAHVSPLPPIFKDRGKVIASLERNIQNLNSSFSTSVIFPTELPYPQNLLQTINEVKNQLDGSYNVKLVEHKGEVAIEVQKEISINNTLYFIDMSKYYSLKESRNFSTANLLLSVFSYLYRVCKLELYQDSFIGGIYECWSEMVEDEENTPLPKAILHKEDFSARVSNRRNLLAYERRVKTFLPENKAEIGLLQVANDFLDFYKQYKDFNIHDTVVYPEQVEDEYTVLTPDEYMSFCYGWTVEPQGEDLMYIVNDHLQEKYEVASPFDQPYLFDQPHQIIDQTNTTYVKNYFKLLDNLAYQLEQL